MGKKLTTIRELIEKDGRWYGGLRPFNLMKFGSNDYGSFHDGWKLFKMGCHYDSLICDDIIEKEKKNA